MIVRWWPSVKANGLWFRGSGRTIKIRKRPCRHRAGRRPHRHEWHATARWNSRCHPSWQVRHVDAKPRWLELLAELPGATGASNRRMQTASLAGDRRGRQPHPRPPALRKVTSVQFSGRPITRMPTMRWMWIRSGSRPWRSYRPFRRGIRCGRRMMTPGNEKSVSSIPCCKGCPLSLSRERRLGVGMGGDQASRVPFRG
jgi:hypothetical protein